MCERRSVVDAVAHHRRKTLSLKLANACELSFRQQVSIHVFKSELAGKRMCSAFIVAREEPGRNAFGFELGKTASCISLDFVSHDKDCQHTEGIRERYARHAGFAGSIEGVGNLIRREPALIKRREVKK